jgi:hypothetical protein
LDFIGPKPMKCPTQFRVSPGNFRLSVPLFVSSWPGCVSTEEAIRERDTGRFTPRRANAVAGYARIWTLDNGAKFLHVDSHEPGRLASDKWQSRYTVQEQPPIAALAV